MSNRIVASVITDSGLCIFVDDQQYVVPSNHPNILKIKEALKNRQYDQIVELVNVRKAVAQYLGKDRSFVLKNDLIHLNDRPFSDAVTDKVLSMLEAGNDAEPLFAFLRNVRLNPSKTAQDELLLFCVANGFMITEDGYILAYKSLNDEYKDIHSGTVLNKPGHLMTETERRSLPQTVNGVTTTTAFDGKKDITIVSISRGQVDDNREKTCSVGLHFAAFGYASTWAGDRIKHIVVMKIHPRDVVSIPNDYDNQKGRCCRYQVVSEIKCGKALPKQEVYSKAVCSCGDPTCNYDFNNA